MILDSPFCDLNTLVYEVASSTLSLPKFIVSPVLSLLKNIANEKINGNLDDINPLEAIKLVRDIPTLFTVAKDDKLTRPEHSEKLYEALPCRNKYI